MNTKLTGTLRFRVADLQTFREWNVLHFQRRVRLIPSSRYLVAPLEAIKTEVRSRRGDIESVTDNYAADQITDLATRAGEVNGVCIVFGNSDSGEGYIVVDGN